MKTFQYKFLKLNLQSPFTFENLEKRGREGWEIISVEKQDDGNHLIVLKKESKNFPTH